MYKLALTIAILMSLPSPALAVETKTLNPETGLVEDSTKKQLKSVKELFNSKKNSVPKVPDVISNQPKIRDLETGEVEAPQEEKITTPELPEEEVAVEKELIEPTNAPQKAQGEKLSEQEFIKQNIGKSILFDNKKVDGMMRVFSAYSKSQDGKEEITQEQDKKSLEQLQLELLAKLNPEDLVKTYEDIITVRLPAYIELNSIIYRSPQNKKAWVNGRKYQDGDGNDELEVRNIQKDYVILTLSTTDANINPEDVRARIKRSGSSSKISLNEEEELITFRLSVNQYADFTRMKIIEGDVDIDSFSLGAADSRYYDPKIPSDRFAPLNEVNEATASNSSVVDSSDFGQEISGIGDTTPIDAAETIN